jgi:hypothetical protein
MEQENRSYQEGESLTKEDLQRFCSTDETRPNLLEPWSQGDFSYAADGYTIIRVPRLSNVEDRQRLQLEAFIWETNKCR